MPILTKQQSHDDILKSVVWKRAGHNLYNALCPVHHEKTPSFYLYPNGQAHCFGCGFHVFDVKSDLRFDSPSSAEQVNTPIHPDFITYWHDLLMKDADRLAYFTDIRGFSLETIKEQMWGWEPVMARYVITVWNGVPQKSDVVQVRLRASHGMMPNKYIGLPGHNYAELYNSHVLEKSESVCFFFGELDAQLATQHGFPSVSMTNGKGTFKTSWLKMFERTRKIVIIPDHGEEIDACKIALLFSGRAQVRTLPLRVNTMEVKDFSDFVSRGGTDEQFNDILLGVGQSFGVYPFWANYYSNLEREQS